MTAGIGGHAIHFAFRKFVSKVVAYEQDPSIAQLLRENIAEMDDFVKAKIEVREESSTNERGRFNLIVCSPDVDKANLSESEKKEFGAFAR